MLGNRKAFAIVYGNPIKWTIDGAFLTVATHEYVDRDIVNFE